MHEFSITGDVIAVRRQQAHGAHATRDPADRRVVGPVGRHGGFCLDVCALGTPVEGAALEIIAIPSRSRCEARGAGSTLQALFGDCRFRDHLLGGTRPTVRTGAVLKIKEMEVL